MKTKSGTGIDMTNYLRSVAVAVLLCSTAVPVRAQQYYLYEPKQVPSGTDVKDGRGVLVKEIPVQSGNTLYGISRKYSGHGMYYPQILLFNNIKNPNLIHVGDTLKVPLPKGDVSDVSSDHSNLKPEKKSVKAVRKRGDKHSSDAVRKIRPVVKATVGGTPSAVAAVPDSAKIDKRKAARRADAGNSVPVIEQAASIPVAGDSRDRRVDAISGGNESAEVKKTAAASTAGQQIYEKAVKAYRQEDYRTALDLFDRYLNENPESVLSADASLYKAECYLKLSSQ